jgi:poly-gamma-glutamate capsule biosynthesis protein CapA/YwtB (metallophosphatase superfamily)
MEGRFHVALHSVQDNVTIFLAGDVMTGRGIDQIQVCSNHPELHEEYVGSAKDYVELAENVHGPVPAPVEPSYVWGDGLRVLEDWAPECSIVNLETSVTTSSRFWPEKAVHYRMHPQNVGCLTVAGIDVCVTANNHVLDFGLPGLAETIETLHDAGIRTVGAGRNQEQACHPVRLRLGGGAELLVVAFGSESSGIPAAWAAGPSRPGVCLTPDLLPMTARAIAGRIRSEKRANELTIASIHWGSNWGYEVSRAQVQFAHTLVENGVDLVHGHSSHHVRPIEIYRGKLILYGCGDLITDYEGIGGHETWRGDLGAMYFATISRKNGRLVSLRLVPMQMRRMRLVRAPRPDVHWLNETLMQVSARFGSRFVEDEEGVLLDLERSVSEEGRGR